MRRFIVEVVIDAIILGIIILFLSLISVAQPFPFGPDRPPDRRATGRRGRRVPDLGGDPGAGQPFRPTRPHRTDRTPVVLDPRSVRGRHQRVRAVADIGHLAGQDRHRRPGPAGHPVDHRRRCAVHAPVDRLRRAPGAQSAGSHGRPQPGDLGVPGATADAPSKHDHREPAALAGLQRHLHHEPRHRPRRHAGRQHPALVRPRRPRRQAGHRRPDRSGADPADAPAAGPDLREDRPDGGQPERRPVAGMDHRAVEAAERGRAVPVRRRRDHRQEGVRLDA